MNNSELYNAVIASVTARDYNTFKELIDDAKGKQIELKLLTLPPTMTIGFLAEYQETFKKMGIKFVL